jgi:hypothetical protein
MSLKKASRWLRRGHHIQAEKSAVAAAAIVLLH